MPSEAGLALDVRAARNALLDLGIAEDHLLYLGESLGTGVVSELAAEHPPAAHHNDPSLAQGEALIGALREAARSAGIGCG